MFKIETFKKAALQEGLIISDITEGNFGKIIYIDFNHDFVRYARIHNETKTGDIINVYCGNSEGIKHGYQFKSYSDMARTINAMSVEG